MGREIPTTCRCRLGSDNFDYVYGSTFGNNTLFCGSGYGQVLDCSDTFGNNVLFAGSAESGHVLYGDFGNDTLYGGDGDQLYGGPGNEVMFADSSNSGCYMQGGSGADTMFGGNGNDIMVAGSGYTVMYAGFGFNSEIAGPEAQMYGNPSGLEDNFIFQGSWESNDNQFATIYNFTDSKDVIDLSNFETNNGLGQGGCFLAPGDYTDPGAISVANGADGNTYVSVQGAAGTPELFFEIAGEHNLTMANFHV
jgi:Ca2+-binding RTX toxin-like protein